MMLAFAHLWILLLLPLPWIVRALLPPRQVRQPSVRVPFGERLRKTIGKEPVSRSGPARPRWIAWAIWVLLLIVLARPQILEPPVSKTIPTRDLLLLVDLSGSMGQEDFTSAAGGKVNRLAAVKEVLGDFLSRRKGDRVGLVVFGDSPFLQAPFSTDLELSRRLLEETAVGMAGPRTAFGDAIGLGINLFADSTAPAKTIIALTDGNDTKSQVPPVEAARIARQKDIRIHAIAIGDPSTVGEDKLDEATLRHVAETAGGSYFFAADRQQLAGIYDELDRIETREVKTVSHQPRRDLFPWPLLAALLISLLDKVLLHLPRSRRFSLAKATASIRVQPITGKLEVIS